MVKIREAHSIQEAPGVDAAAWLARLPGVQQNPAYPALRDALDLVLQAYADAEPAERQRRVHSCLDILDTLSGLQLDQTALLAGILCLPMGDGRLDPQAIAKRFGPAVAAVVDGVQRMDALHMEATSDGRKGSFASQQRQGENLRRMLVAMIDDPRVALVKLAERIQALRAKHTDSALREGTAREAMEIYAPLAHRLGVGQIKWEVEDLAFRVLHAANYRNIAGALDERRVDRENFIASAITQLKTALAEAGIQAQLSGRPKHLYSIWSKMQRKGIGIGEVYDTRAVRILVDSVADCYSALGLVHGLWRNLPGEFDDYIANPKPNGYRSLHTAVIGDGGKVLEVQIRTRAMHEEAELGICAHWRYKGDDGQAERSGYEEKIGWLRQVLGWGEELGAGELISEHLRREIGADRIYVLTPDGHVVDLPRGATAVDFAYHVHSELGHRCRGAKVNGHIVSLDHALQTGDRVEIMKGRHAAPNRDWLLAGNEFVHTARARSKIRHWFRQQNREHLVAEGRAVIEREIKRLALAEPAPPVLAKQLGFATEDDLLVALGTGDLGVGQLVSALAPPPVAPPERFAELRRPTQRKRRSGAVAVAGVHNLLTQFAGCCKPVPGDAIAGFVTEGRGISVHQSGCKKFAALAKRHPERLVEVVWQADQPHTHAVGIRIVAHDRSALLKDIVTLLGNERINILDLATQVDQARQIATTRLSIEVASLQVLGRTLEKLSRVGGVISARRQAD